MRKAHGYKPAGTHELYLLHPAPTTMLAFFVLVPQVRQIMVHGGGKWELRCKRNAKLPTSPQHMRQGTCSVAISNTYHGPTNVGRKNMNLVLPGVQDCRTADLRHCKDMPKRNLLITSC